MKFTIHQGSRQGPRSYNQDRQAYSYSKDALLLVIADGMGGHRHGEVAAQLAVKNITDAFQRMATPGLGDPAQFLKEHIQQIHDAIGHLTLDQGLLEAPRTTIVAAVLQDDGLYCAHVGDSRLYHFRNGRLLFRTEDHSIVQMLYRRGELEEQAMLEHPARHKIYNCLGADHPPKIDLTHKHVLRDGDTLLLCTDGLWSIFSDEEMSAILHAGPVNESVPTLLDMAESLCEAQGDNMSAIGVQWGNRYEDNLLAISTMTMPLGTTTTIVNPMTQQPTLRDDHAQVIADLTDGEIEQAITEIQTAIRKTQR